MTSSGSLEHCCHGEDAHTHTHIDSFTPARPLQQQLHLDLLCECVQCSVFMDVVQMVTSHCQAQRLPSPPVPWLGSSGTSCRLLRHGGREGERAQVRYTTSTHKHLHDMSRSTKICTPVHPCTFCDIIVNQVRSLWCEQMQNQNTITSKTPDIQPTDEKPAHSLQQLPSGNTVFYIMNTTAGTLSFFCLWVEQMCNRLQRVTAGSWVAYSQVSASFSWAHLHSLLRALPHPYLYSPWYLLPYTYLSHAPSPVDIWIYSLSPSSSSF